MSIEDDFLAALKKIRDVRMVQCDELALMPGLGVIGCSFPRYHTGKHSTRCDGKLVEWSEDGVVYEVYAQ